MRDLSRVADAAVEIALATAIEHLLRALVSRPLPAASGHCVVLAFGKHGGEEPNYSSDIDLMFLYDADGATHGGLSSIGNDEFHARVASEVIRLLWRHWPWPGVSCRCPAPAPGQRGPGPFAGEHPHLLRHARPHLGTPGPIKVRPVAGDLELGVRFLQAI